MTIKSEANARSATCATDKNVSDHKTTTEGLFLRVTSGGAKSWRMRSRKTGQVTLGKFPAISFADAKTLAAGLLTDAARRAVNETVEASAVPTLAVNDRRTLRALLDEYGKASDTVRRHGIKSGSSLSTGTAITWTKV